MKMQMEMNIMKYMELVMGPDIEKLHTCAFHFFTCWGVSMMVRWIGKLQ